MSPAVAFRCPHTHPNDRLIWLDDEVEGRLRYVGTNYCLDNSRGEGHDGNMAWMWPCDGNLVNQQWLAT